MTNKQMKKKKTEEIEETETENNWYNQKTQNSI